MNNNLIDFWDQKVPEKCQSENAEYEISVKFRMNPEKFQKKFRVTGILPEFVETPDPGVSDYFYCSFTINSKSDI